MVSASTPGARLVRRLREEHGIDIPATAHVLRTGAGRHQRAAGAWTWHLEAVEDGRRVFVPYGSQSRVTDLLRCRAWVVEQPTHWRPDATIDLCLDCSLGAPRCPGVKGPDGGGLR
jgi:hypothetical protein